MDGEDALISGQGGGSGGSIFIQAPSISGYGALSSQGGNAFTNSAGGGGGGRVAIHVESAYNFKGTVYVGGGDGHERGSSGTIYIQHSNDKNELILSGFTCEATSLDSNSLDGIEQIVNQCDCLMTRS